MLPAGLSEEPFSSVIRYLMPTWMRASLGEADDKKSVVVAFMGRARGTKVATVCVQFKYDDLILCVDPIAFITERSLRAIESLQAFEGTANERSSRGQH